MIQKYLKQTYIKEQTISKANAHISGKAFIDIPFIFLNIHFIFQIIYRILNLYE